MDGRKVRFGVLIAAAVVLPSTGYLVGFTKAQTTDEDWSAEIKADLDRLSPTLVGVAALQHSEELKLTDAEKVAVLKVVRQDGPELIEKQREEWAKELERARAIFLGDEIVSEFRGLYSLQQAENRPVQQAEIRHSMHIFRVLPRKKLDQAHKKSQQALERLREERFFMVLDPANSDELRLSQRQRRQLVRLASYFVTLMEKKTYGFDGPFPTLELDDAIARLKKADRGQIVMFSYQVEDYLDPLQQMKLRAMVIEKTHAPIP